MTKLSDLLELRVRYGETDQMGTFYNARALDWFECGRSELMRRRLGMSYAALEEKGVYLPVVEAHLEFQGGARYDDLLKVASVADLFGRARLRFDVQITQADSSRPVVRGYTIHAFTDRQAKPLRPPAWFVEMMTKAGMFWNVKTKNPKMKRKQPSTRRIATNHVSRFAGRSKRRSGMNHAPLIHRRLEEFIDFFPKLDSILLFAESVAFLVFHNQAVKFAALL